MGEQETLNNLGTMSNTGEITVPGAKLYYRIIVTKAV